MMNSYFKLLKENSEESIFSKMEIKLFKFINRFKKELGDRSTMIRFIENSLSTFGIPKNEANKYYELYTLNYRPDGDYENVTKSNFKDPKIYSKQKRTTNAGAREFTSNKLPFAGSNLSGEWTNTRDNEWAYIVKSYGWYPIYVFKYNKWFEVDNTYSSSTSKQMRQSYPVKYNSDLKDMAIIVNNNEINQVINGHLKPEDLLSTRANSFIESMKTKQKKKELTTFTHGWGDKKVRVRYLISSVRKAGSMYKITVDVMNVDKFIGNKLDREAGDFFNDEMENIDRDLIKKYIQYHFADKYGSQFKGLSGDIYTINVIFKGK